MLARNDDAKTRPAIPMVLARDFGASAGRKGGVAVVAVLAAALLDGLGLSLLAPLTGIITRGPAHGVWDRCAALLFSILQVTGAAGRLAVLLGVFGLVMLLRAAALWARDILLAQIQFGFTEALRLRIVRRLAEARWNAVAGLRHARVTHALSGDIQRLGAGLYACLQAAVGVAMVAAQALLMLLLAPAVGGAILVLLAVGVVIAGPALATARRAGSDVVTANLALMDSSTQFLGGLKLAISQNLQQGFVTETEMAIAQVVERQNHHSRQQARSRAIIALLAALAGAGLVLAGFTVLHLAPALLVTLLVILSRMMAPLSQVQQGLQQAAYTLAVYEKVCDLDADLAAVKSPAALSRNVAPRGDIVFERVSFNHGGGGVHNLSLTIRAGEFIAITGPSGSGKTTFADLLATLYPPQSGCITVGGAELGSVAAAWRDSLAYVAQETFLFHGSLRRNFLWARPDATEPQMWEALSRMGAEALARRIGLDTPLGERGTLVSGGERQRVALARALLRRPRLMILDEATGAIDSAGERAIFEELRTLDMTIVMIVHRVANLDLCDRVLDATGFHAAP